MKSEYRKLYDLYIKNIAHKMRYICDQKVSEYGLTSSQAILLGIISRSVKEERELSRAYLQAAMKIRGPSVTNLLNKLERGGYIFRSTGQTDGRTFHIQVTVKGETFVNEMDTVFEQIEDQLLKGMSDETKETFLILLKQASDNMDKATF